MPAKEVTDATFDTDVLTAGRPVLVDFWAEWCMPCKKIHAVLDEIAGTELGQRIEIVKMNIDDNSTTAMRYQVMSLPTLTIFKNGEPVASVGAKSKSEIIQFIEDAL
jgi:thioredoxin 1